MRRHMIAGLAAVTLALAGCGSTLSTDDAKINVDRDDGSFTIETEEGEVNFEAGGGGSLPEGFPSDFPLPDNLNIIVSSSGSGGSNKVDAILNVTATTNQPVDDLRSFYTKELPAKGWTIKAQNQTNIGGKNNTVSLTAEKGSTQANVAIIDGDTTASDGDATTLTITIAAKS